MVKYNDILKSKLLKISFIKMLLIGYVWERRGGKGLWLVFPLFGSFTK